ncbi:MAG: hypothetical protein ACOYMR_00580 [Ilumatobacteraceae bacterium]
MSATQRPLRRLLPLTLLAGLLLAACGTGERPYFSEEPAFPAGEMTGDPAIDAVLGKLDNATSGPATASYEVLTKYGNTTHPAVVVLDPGKRSVTIGNVHYIQTEALAVTCTEDGSQPCVDGFDPQRISDTGITYDFYASDTAKRLRRDADAKIGPATASTATVAEQQTTCVELPLTGGTAVYCVLANGLVAKLDDGDVLITMVLFGDTVDPNNFVPPA